MVRTPDHTRLVIGRREFTVRAVLRQNVKALMESGRGPRSQSALREKSGVAQATIGRILSNKGENSGVETIERIAKAYDLEAWQLLIAGMDPTNPPVLQPISAVERALYERLKGVAQDLAKYQK